MKVKESLIKSKYFLAIISKSSIESHWMQWECQMAIEKEKKNKRPHIILILIEDVKIPLYFIDKQCVDFCHDYKNNVKKIEKMIKVKL